MIELTLFADGYPMTTSTTLVMIDQITHIRDAGRGMTSIEFTNKERIVVCENLREVEKRIRAYAEQAQKERVGEMVRRELRCILEQAWRYEENSK